MNFSRSLRRSAAVSVLAALAVPVAASAHPGVYTVTQAVRPANATCLFPDTSCLTTATQYAVANDGWALGFTEGNGVAGVQADTTAGMINYKAMPGNWRTNMTSEQKRTYAAAQTNLQPHATCSGSAILDTSANVLAWQSADPFFNYIPWQKTSAGVGDEPSKWLPVVKTATGIDLSTLTDAASFKTACEAAPVLGAYHAADVSAAIATAAIAAATAPLQTQIDTLTPQVSTLQSQVDQLKNQVTTLEAAKAAADAAAATATTLANTKNTAATDAQNAAAAAQAAATAAETARLALANRPLTLTLSSKRFAEGVAMVTGAAGTPVTVTMQLTAANAKEFKLAQTVATRKVTLGASGADLLSLALTSKAAKAINKHGHSLKVSVVATAAGTSQTVAGTLTR